MLPEMRKRLAPGNFPKVFVRAAKSFAAIGRIYSQEVFHNTSMTSCTEDFDIKDSQSTNASYIQYDQLQLTLLECPTRIPKEHR